MTSITGDLGQQTKAIVDGLPATGDSFTSVDRAHQGVALTRMPIIPKSVLLNANSYANKNYLSGKEMAAIIVAQNAVANNPRDELAIFLSLGDTRTSPWNHLANLQDWPSIDSLTPIGDLPIAGVIGDVKNYEAEQAYGATSLRIDTVDKSLLTDANSFVNTFSQSGKGAGSLIICKDGDKKYLMGAKGINPVDGWKTLNQLTGTTTEFPDIIPVVTATPSNITGDINATMQPTHGCILSGFPSQKESVFQDINSALNATKESGKTLGSVVIATSDDNTRVGIYCATGTPKNHWWALIFTIKGSPETYLKPVVQ